MEAQTVLSIYNSLEELGVPIWIDGGWGVDALLETQTRDHNDLDIVVEQRHVLHLRDFLKDYREIKLEIARPHNFVLADPSSNEIDVHVIEIDQVGNGIYGPPEKGEMYPRASLTGVGKIDGQTVRCISAEWTLKFHSGYELKDKDYRDMSALCTKFNLELPTEYQKFQLS
jgi:lincosamide nucleotidyltransferase A/C/D/E